MRYKINIVWIVLSILTTIEVQSQTGEKIDIIRLNGITYSGDRIFGIHLNKEEAIQITLQLMDEKNKHEDKVKEVKISAETVDKKKGFQVFEQFRGASTRRYWKIPKQEFETLTPDKKMHY